MTTPKNLRAAVRLLEEHDLHTADGLVGPTGALDVCTAISYGTTGVLPAVFRTDQAAALAFIKNSVGAMAAIRAVYDSLGTGMDTDGPDEVIDRVSHWAATAPDRHAQPPTRLEVIGRLLRVADDLERRAAPAA